MLAIAGGKGGCGKTTTALGLARALARRGDRPLVVDADRDMPNLHTRADVSREPGLDALAAGQSLSRLTATSRAYPGVEVLPAGTPTEPVEATAYDRLREYRGPVLLDCPAGASEGAVAPLRAADDAVVVSTPVPVSLVDAVKTARIVQALGTRLVGTVLVRTGDGPDGPPVENEPRSRDRTDERPGKQGLNGGRSGSEPPVTAPSPPEPILAQVPETDGDPLGTTVGRAAYDRLATAVNERNI